MNFDKGFYREFYERYKVVTLLRGGMPDGTDRVTVSTYVPAEQRDIWAADAESLGMSQSEFVRTMVQAGRRGFSLGGGSSMAVEPDVAGSDPRSDGLESTVLEVLRQEGPLGWDRLFESVAGEIEAELDEAVTDLLEAGRLEHRPRTGEYSLGEVADGD